ncbi:tetratricopeptide repeat protein, partial [Thermoleptolyngbya sp. M55_K2018_002]|uniref:tetratricopeptide repeat protein n=1 Tax=Thermoleptolyngbya sp. M55_K2018_002 TaxID=2747808 RepID=UPI0019FF41EC
MTASPAHDLETQNQNAYDDLLTAIEASEGQLSLLISVCDDSQLREALIARYERDLAPEVKAYRLVLDKDEPSLRAAIYTAVQNDEYLKQGGRAVLTLTGAEQLSFLSQSDELSEQDRFFGYLQWTREALRDFRFPIVIWVTYQILGHLSRKSPDFWSWRKGVFRFVSRKTITVPARELEPFRTFGLDLPKLDDDALLPLEDLKALLQNVEQQNPADPLLGTLYAQLGRIYARRLETGEALDYPAELAQAIEYFERAIALQEKNEQSIDLAASLNNLAGLYQSMGRYSEVEPLYGRSLAIREAQLGKDHPDTATSLNNLAGLYQSMGRYSEAEPLYLRALSIVVSQLGQDHPSS